MAVINDIKQRILQLDAGSFQSMCDRYLSRMGYPSIVSLGTRAGTQKTTPGTPDTYFFDTNGKYVFVEYTTQQNNLPAKIKSDLEKCLDVSATQIPHNKISEIIYCHTSSNIAPKDDAAFRTMCESVGIKFTIYGIDQLAQDLYLKYRGIAKDYLHLAIDTNQIETKDEFVRHYDASNLAAPLSTQFLFREDSLESLDTLFEQTNVVILTGPAGTGKTRLAIHYADLYAQKTGAQLFCVHDNALPIYEDLSLYMETPGSYILVVDDANQLSGLQHVVQYAIKQAEGYDVQILITVRDYAISKVKHEIEGIVSFKTLAVTSLSDEQIKQLIKQELGILNENYLARIARLAEGNARIAMLAGKLACEANRLDSIADITQLYAAYYDKALVEAGLNTRKELMVTAGLVAFLRTLHIDHIDWLLPVLEQEGLTKNAFIENLYDLHKLEIVDICNDKAVRFSEQCLANYILKHVFVDQKTVSLKAMIRACFEPSRERTLSAINTLLGVYHVEELQEFITNEIKALWYELAEEKSPMFFEYVKAFYPVNPTETLLMMQGIIDAEETVFIPIEEINTNVEKSYQTINNEVLKILGGFANTEDLEAALDLFFTFYQKRPDLFVEFYHTITSCFSVSRHSYEYGFYTQIKLLQKFKEYSNGWDNQYVSQLFLAVIPKFLGLHFEDVEEGRRKTVSFNSFFLVLSEGVEVYREIAWESLHALCMKSIYHVQIYNLLKGYGQTFDDNCKDVIKLDVKHITAIMETAFPADSLSNCLLAEKLIQVLSTAGEDVVHTLGGYISTQKLEVYQLIKGPQYSLDLNYHEREKIKKEQIKRYVSDCSVERLIEIIDICGECTSFNGDDEYEITEGLSIAFSEFFAMGDSFADVVRYYLKANTPFNISPISILKDLFSIMESKNVYELISAEDYEQKNAWIYAYYHELPDEAIDSAQLNGLYTFLKDPSDSELKKSPYRNIVFLEKYRKVDGNAVITGSRIILSKVNDSPYAAHLYFGLLFNIYSNSPTTVVERFKGDLELLEDIYIESIAYSRHDDYDGSFLKEIYQASPSILNKYISRILCETQKLHFNEQRDRNLVFFDVDNANEIFDRFVDELIKTAEYAVYVVPDFIKSIITPKQNDDMLQKKQDQWIRHFITAHSNDVNKMKYIFHAIASLQVERKVAYVKLFLDYNDGYDAFESLPLFPLLFRWSNSAVPYLNARIKYLEQLLPIFVGLKFVKHKKLVEQQIEGLKEEIRQEEIHDILDS